MKEVTMGRFHTKSASHTRFKRRVLNIPQQLGQAETVLKYHWSSLLGSRSKYGPRWELHFSFWDIFFYGRKYNLRIKQTYIFLFGPSSALWMLGVNWVLSWDLYWHNDGLMPGIMKYSLVEVCVVLCCCLLCALHCCSGIEISLSLFSDPI